ncbi:hypothetical protein [Bradyrhizobium sp.]|jgi:hypothetical protein|uniref:hypothetical protein n=1 Tax=Bradyrhizobium sp. TaxID=376 RepID=UPI002DDDAFAB|nr:hypothetical protein [Bradyrhizobium sp.]HEV2155410.1 hypothetical protein [Bradyrhizobium sp.]
MPKFNDKFAVISGVLNADVANNGTFTVAYPTGFASQQYFDTGLAVPGQGTILLNNSDRYTIAGGGFTLAFGGSNITVTNTSGVTWSAGTAFTLNIDKQDGNVINTVTIAYNLASIANGALLNPGLRLGFKGTIEYCEAYVQTPATTAAKLSSVNPTINGVDVTGGVMALTSANMTPAGVTVAGSLITGANAFDESAKIGLKASATTAFVEGVVQFYLRCRHTASDAF